MNTNSRESFKKKMTYELNLDSPISNPRRSSVMLNINVVPTMVKFEEENNSISEHRGEDENNSPFSILTPASQASRLSRPAKNTHEDHCCTPKQSHTTDSKLRVDTNTSK